MSTEWFVVHTSDSWKSNEGHDGLSGGFGGQGWMGRSGGRSTSRRILLVERPDTTRTRNNAPTLPARMQIEIFFRFRRSGHSSSLCIRRPRSLCVHPRPSCVHARTHACMHARMAAAAAAAAVASDEAAEAEAAEAATWCEAGPPPPRHQRSTTPCSRRRRSREVLSARELT